MLVQCPSCSARYKVNDANIPPTGGKIRCPKCSHTFVVYPESNEPEVDATQIASVGGGYDDARTSIADIASLMKGGGGRTPPQEEDGATEIMSGDSLPDFSSMFNGGGGGAPAGGGQEFPEDGTVEMQNPMELLQKAGWSPSGGGGQAPAPAPAPAYEEEGDGATEIVSADMVFGGGAPGGNPFGGAPQPQSQPQQPAQPAFGGGFASGPAPQQPAPQQPAPSPFGGAPQQPASPFGGAPQQPAQPAFGGGGFGSPQPEAPGEPRPRSKTQFGGWNAQDVTAAAQAAAAPAPSLDPPQPTGGFAGGDPFAGVDMGGGAPGAAAGPDPNHGGPWKLKTPFGLAYEFQDTKSLLGWMSSRDDLNGYTLSQGDESFFPIEEFPQVMSQLSGKGARALSGSQPAVAAPAPAPGPMPGMGGMGGGMPGPSDPGMPGPPAGGGFGMGGDPGGFGPSPQEPPRQPGQKIASPGFETKPSKGKGLTGILILLFVVFGLVVVMLSLHIFKVIDIKAMISGEPPAVEKKIDAPAAPAAKADEAPADEGDEQAGVSDEIKKEVDQLVEGAREQIDQKKLMDAKRKLETARDLDPNRFEVYDLLAKVYDELGDADGASETREKVKELRSSAGASP